MKLKLRPWLFRWLRQKIGLNSLAGEFYSHRGQFLEWKEFVNGLDRRMKEGREASTCRAEEYLGALRQHLELEPFREMELDPNYLPPEPKMRQVIKYRPIKSAKKK